VRWLPFVGTGLNPVPTRVGCPPNAP
jgi:hypothetical protein